jgi:hypothetical protein
VRRGRPTIHPYESHVTPPSSRQQARGGHFATELSGRAPANQPSAIAIPAGLEAIRAPPRAEGSSPGIVSYQTKPSAADGATLWSTIPRLLRVAAHCGLLFGLPQVGRCGRLTNNASYSTEARFFLTRIVSFSRAEAFPIAISVRPPKPVLQLHEGNFSKAKESEERYVGLRLAFWIPRVAKANWYQAIIATALHPRRSSSPRH